MMNIADLPPPPSYEDAIAEDIGPVDGLRRDYNDMPAGVGTSSLTAGVSSLGISSGGGGGDKGGGGGGGGGGGIGGRRSEGGDERRYEEEGRREDPGMGMGMRRPNTSGGEGGT